MVDHYGDIVLCGIIVFISLFLGKLRKCFAADLSFVLVLQETQKSEMYFVVRLKILVCASA
jgi:hypothetical protein